MTSLICFFAHICFRLIAAKCRGVSHSPEVREGVIEQKRYLRMKRRFVTCFPIGGSVRVMRTIAVREILRFIAASNVSICFGRKRWQWFATPHAFRFRQ